MPRIRLTFPKTAAILFVLPALTLFFRSTSGATAVIDEGAPPAPAEKLVGGVGLTRLTVYDQRLAPDGLMSGSPHVHAVTDEGYYVLGGKGRVELHDVRDGFRSVDLLPGRYLQFPPGTLHRLVNDGHLVILVVMGNGGLAERGDARIYFGPRVDGDPAEYARLNGLASANGLAGALDRRDAAVRAYAGLIDLWTKNREAYFTELARFIDVHRRSAAGLRPSFAEAVQTGPAAWSELFKKRVAALPGQVQEGAPILHVPPAGTTLGMCGLLRPVTSFEEVVRAAGSDRSR